MLPLKWLMNLFEKWSLGDIQCWRWLGFPWGNSWIYMDPVMFGYDISQIWDVELLWAWEVQSSDLKDFLAKTVYIYIYLEPICPPFWWLNPPKQGLFQSKQGSFGFQASYISSFMHIAGADVLHVDNTVFNVMERAHAQLIADSVAVNVNVHYKATLEKCGGSALVDLFSSILFLNLSSGAYLSSDAFAIGIGGARCGADRQGDAYAWQDYLLLLAEGSQAPLSMALALRVLTSRLKTAHTYTGSRLDRRRATRSLSKTGMDLSTGILDSAVPAVIESLGVDVSTVAPVLASPKTGSSAVGALEEALELLLGIQQLIASSGYDSRIDYLTAIGCQMSYEGMRSTLRGVRKESAKFCRFYRYLTGKVVHDLSSNNDFKTVLKTVGPVISSLDRSNAPSQAILELRFQKFPCQNSKCVFPKIVVPPNHRC